MATINLKRILWTQTIVAAVCCLALSLVAPALVEPFSAGAALITINFALLAAFWQRFMDKKPVATTLGIIVIKYAILGVLLYVFVKELKLPLLPLFAGVSTLGGTFIIVALQTQHGLGKAQ
jgi:hypothetical protein